MEKFLEFETSRVSLTVFVVLFFGYFFSLMKNWKFELFSLEKCNLNIHNTWCILLFLFSLHKIFKKNFSFSLVFLSEKANGVKFMFSNKYFSWKKLQLSSWFWNKKVESIYFLHSSFRHFKKVMVGENGNHFVSWKKFLSLKLNDAWDEHRVFVSFSLIVFVVSTSFTFLLSTTGNC